MEVSLNQLTKGGDFADLSASHYNLDSSFNILETGFDDLSANHYNLDSSFVALETGFDDLSGKHYLLEVSLNEVTKGGDFADLSASHYNLDSSFNILETGFDDLSGKYYNLDSSFVALETGFDDLSGNFSNLSDNFSNLSGNHNSLDNSFSNFIDNEYADLFNVVNNLNNIRVSSYIPKPYIARHPNVYVKNNYTAIEVGRVFKSASNEIVLVVDLGSIELLNVEQYYDDENKVVDSSGDGYSRVLGEIENDHGGGVIVNSMINNRPNQDVAISSGTTGLQYFEQSIPIPAEGVHLLGSSDLVNTITDNSYNGFHFCMIECRFTIGPIPRDFAGNPFTGGDKYIHETFPYNRPEWNSGASHNGQTATINFYVCPSHFNYQGTDISENENDTSWYAPLTINDVSAQPITAHNLLQYQPIDDNPETSYIYLNYTHSEETPHRFYISNTLYNYWTATDYSKNLQIFSPNINEDGWIKENNGNWEWDDTIDISNTSSAEKRYTITYRKIICTDNAEIEAKKYRIGFI